MNYDNSKHDNYRYFLLYERGSGREYSAYHYFVWLGHSVLYRSEFG